MSKRYVDFYDDVTYDYWQLVLLSLLIKYDSLSSRLLTRKCRKANPVLKLLLELVTTLKIRL